MCDCDFGKGLTTQHCSVRGCHQTFSSSTAGDMHRTGKHHISTGPGRRRCLTVDEMLVKGMVRNSRGIWMSSAREEKMSA